MSVSDTVSSNEELSAVGLSYENDSSSRYVAWLSGGFIALFVALALYDKALLSSMVNTSFAWSVTYFGAYWQVLMLLTFVVALVIALGRAGDVKLGNLAKPEMTTFQWLAIILCTLMAGGGVFWAASEPIAHFMSAPPLFGQAASVGERASNALAQSFLHWGFLAWAINGTLTAIVLMHLHYNKGLPLRPRTLLYPVLGKYAMGRFGDFVDAACIISVVAGTVGPIGFLGLQLSYSFEKLYGIDNTYTLKFLIVAAAVVFYTLSAMSGVNRGIRFLSRINVILGLVLLVFVFIFGASAFISNQYISGVGAMVSTFVEMSLFRQDTAWLSYWTVFFWGWFIGYGPLMAMLVAKISRGRTIRQIVICIAVVAPFIMMLAFTVLGGSGLFYEINQPGVISGPFNSDGGFNLPAVLLAITGQLPWSTLITVLFLVLTTIFILTTGDSMTYCISMAISGSDGPSKKIRVYWGVMMGATAVILISLGAGGIGALQSFIVITAVPVSLVVLPALWNAPQIAYQLYKEQEADK